MGNRPTLVVVGAAARDVDASDPRGWRLGGTVAYSSLAAARLGVAVQALIGVDREGQGADELDLLRAAGVDVRIVPLERGPVFQNRHTANGRVQVAHQASDPIPVSALPAGWAAAADVALLGPIAAEVGDDWTTALSRTTFLALTWQGLLRRLVPGRPVEPLAAQRQPLVARANALLLSAEDVGAGAPPVRELLGERQHLLVTHGRHGAAHLQLASGRLEGRIIPSVPRREAIDATGAGDVFLAVWLAARMLAPTAHADRHLAVASVAASLKVAKHGLDGVPHRSDICRELLRPRDSLA